MTTLTALTDSEVEAAVASCAPGKHLLPVAGGTKPALSSATRDDVTLIDVSALHGIIAYDPAELTLTARAGTPIRELEATLREHGQYLPFDPPFAAAGATIGGVVAAGTSGSGAWRYGGVRDFVLGVRFVDGTGRAISAGGRVVKNAAGFDVPKLMVGSIGRLGIMLELSLKVFPRSPAAVTLEFALGSTAAAAEAALELERSPIQLDALDIAPGGRLLARLAGRPEDIEPRARRLASVLASPPQSFRGADERELWRQVWHPVTAGDAGTLVRATSSLRAAAGLDTALAATVGAVAHYSAGATAAWIRWPQDAALDRLDELLAQQGLAGMVLLGPPDRPLIGRQNGGQFARRIARGIDPDSRFLEL